MAIAAIQILKYYYISWTNIYIYIITYDDDDDDGKW